MPAKILFKYTSRSRVDNFFRGLDSIVNNLSNKEDYHILCSFDVDDSAYSNQSFVDRLNGYSNLSYYFGISHSKINAINRDLPLAPPFDILVNYSDDQIFLKNGFDDDIRNDFNGDFDLFIHYPDSNVKHLLPTMSVMGVDYFKRFNYIYMEDFRNVYCDNAEMDKAKILKKYKYVERQIFDHLHPAFGRAPMDAQYEKTENKEGYAKDHATYIRLKKNNFGL